MTFPQSFWQLSDVFAGKVGNNIQCFQLIKALILDMEHVVDRDLHEEVARQLVSSTFSFNGVVCLKRDRYINGEDFIQLYLQCIHGKAYLDFSAEPLSIVNVPPCLKGSFRVEPLVGPNISCIRPSQGEDSAHESRRFIMLWYCNHPQRTDVCLYVVDLQENSVYGLPTYGFWIYSDFLSISMGALPMDVWRDPQARDRHLRSLKVGQSMALMPSPCPIHYGHYLQNNLAHLARLEEMGITDQVSTIFRPSGFDYFLPSQEQAFFLPATQSKMKVVENRQHGFGMSIDATTALVVSKGSTFGRTLSRNLRSSLNCSSSGDDSRIGVCVGIRGGTRMCLNLLEFTGALSTALHQKYNREIFLVVDGMSSSVLNNSDTTAMLSPAFENELANGYLAFADQSDFVSATSVVGLTQYEQLVEISKCTLALSGFGTQSFKYMYLCDVPTVVHGQKPADRNLDSGEPPVNMFLGVDCLESIDHTDDPQRYNYRVFVDESVKRCLDFIDEQNLVRPA
ncbi:MAG: hypothetical protein ACOYMY_04985 [Prochlorococcaceae cyanobacterium]